jgi:hypothetical protein
MGLHKAKEKSEAGFLGPASASSGRKKLYLPGW